MSEIYLSPEKRKELEYLNSQKKKHPELFEPGGAFVESEEALKSIGIEGVFGKARPKAYLKLWPQDFVVEEVAKEGNLYTTDDGPKRKEREELSEEDATVYATLVKAGRSTFEVVDEMSEALGLERKRVGYAGIKDKQALSSQLISFRETNYKAVEDLEVAGMFLKDIYTGKGVVDRGALYGNKFTIVLRALEDIDKEYFEQRIKELKENGFYNFFYLQRFGTPRLLTHYYGMLLFRGEYEKLILTMLGQGSRWELPYFRQFRAELWELGTDWGKVKEKISNFPVIMRQENIVVDYLIDNPGDYIGALQQIPDQIRISAYAYSSYLFNKVLSGLIQSGGGVPPKLPLVLSFEEADRAPYKELLEADNISFPFHGLKPFPFIRLQKRYVPTRFQPEVEHAVLKSKGAVLNFTLKKGAYATTFLSHIFTLVSGLPLPEDLYLKPVDPKDILGTGSISGTVKKLDKFIMRRGMDMDEVLD